VQRRCDLLILLFCFPVAHPFKPKLMSPSAFQQAPCALGLMYLGMEMDSAEILVLQASYSNPVHAEAIGIVLNHYAEDPMGGGHPIAPELLQRLPEELARRPHAFSVLAFVGGEPAGLVNCFEGFSTFACKPLVNVHDVAVVGKFRGLGLSQKMLQKVEEIARQRGCCKITLEVLEGNAVAQGSYRKFGFAPGMFNPDHGRMLFWIKDLQA